MPKTKKELIAELKALKIKMYRYKTICQTVKRIDRRMNEIWDELMTKHGMSEEELFDIELNVF